MKLMAFDIGGTSVKTGLFVDKELAEKSSFNTPNSFDKLILEMKKYIKPDIDGVAISAPGVVDIQNRVIRNESAVPYIHNRPIFDELETALERPVMIENDANCAGICEITFGAGENFNNIAFIVIGTGVGGSVFINKKIYKGAHLSGGEFGFMKDKDGRTLSNSATLVKGVAAYNKHVSEKKIKNGQELFALAKDGDRLAQDIIDNIYNRIAEGLYNLQVAFDFDAFIFGGGISARADLSKEIRKRLAKLLADNVTDNIMPVVKSCKFHNDANLYGAVVSFLQNKDYVKVI